MRNAMTLSVQKVPLERAEQRWSIRWDFSQIAGDA